MKKQPTLRFFARFKGQFGYLRAVARYGEIRKTILTPLVISRDQLPRLDSIGRIKVSSGNIDDMRLDGFLREYTAIAWEVIKELLACGGFASIPSKSLTATIIERRNDMEAQRRKIADATFQRQAEEAKAKGYELRRVTLQELADILKELKDKLSPEEYAAIWEKGDKDGKL